MLRKNMGESNLSFVKNFDVSVIGKKLAGLMKKYVN